MKEQKRYNENTHGGLLKLKNLPLQMIWSNVGLYTIYIIRSLPSLVISTLAGSCLETKGPA